MITKVKYKSGCVEIHQEFDHGKTSRQTIFKCVEEPHPDFKAVLVELERVARAILELPNNVWVGAMKINSVSFSLSETTGVRGAVLTGTVDLPTSNSPFCFNTPHLPFDQYSEGGDSPIMPRFGIEALGKLEEEATAYFEGSKRAQLEMELIKQ